MYDIFIYCPGKYDEEAYPEKKMYKFLPRKKGNMSLIL